MKNLALCFSVLFLLGCSEQARIETAVPEPKAMAFDPQQAFDTHCAHCHDGSMPKAPHQIKFQLMGVRAIEDAMTSGLMKEEAAALSAEQRQLLAAHLGGAEVASTPVLRCDTTTVPAAPPVTEGWSLTKEGTRFIGAEVAGLPPEKVPELKLEWAFTYPGASRARSQPVPFGDALLVGSQSGDVYALDLASGCAHWVFEAEAEVRSALALSPDGTHAYFGDIGGRLYAIDPTSGTQLWRTEVDDHPDVTITGSPRLHEQTVYVPLSSSEWASAADPGYPCCTFRGGVAAFSADSGEHLWTAYSIADTPKPTGRKNDLGADLHHPAGAPVWNTPTIDTANGLVLVGTGEAYTSPAADTSDAVLAFDLKTGERRWAYQSIAGDAWNMACFIGGGPNCPEEDGPDLDIGAPPMVIDVGDRRMVIAGQKSGHVFALDAASGELIWRNKIGRGGFAGGVHWGMATDGERIYAPNADTVFTGRFKGERKPGLFALDIDTGEIRWFTPAPDVCAEAYKPACDPGLSAAVTAIPGVVFAGAFDGHLRAYAADTGEVLWDFDTNRQFESVSGEMAKGGSIEADGPVIYRGHVLVNSGYLFGDRMAGNALLAFSSAGETDE